MIQWHHGVSNSLSVLTSFVPAVVLFFLFVWAQVNIKSHFTFPIFTEVTFISSDAATNENVKFL